MSVRVEVIFFFFNFFVSVTIFYLSYLILVKLLCCFNSTAD